MAAPLTNDEEQIVYSIDEEIDTLDLPVVDYSALPVAIPDSVRENLKSILSLYIPEGWVYALGISNSQADEFLVSLISVPLSSLRVEVPGASQTPFYIVAAKTPCFEGRLWYKYDELTQSFYLDYQVSAVDQPRLEYKIVSSEWSIYAVDSKTRRGTPSWVSNYGFNYDSGGPTSITYVLPNFYFSSFYIIFDSGYSGRVVDFPTYKESLTEISNPYVPLPGGLGISPLGPLDAPEEVSEGGVNYEKAILAGLCTAALVWCLLRMRRSWYTGRVL